LRSLWASKSSHGCHQHIQQFNYELTGFGGMIIQGNNEISFRTFSVSNVSLDNDRRCVTNVQLLYGISAEPLVYNTLYKYKLAEIAG
jgi:hypothetical protein